MIVQTEWTAQAIGLVLEALGHHKRKGNDHVVASDISVILIESALAGAFRKGEFAADEPSPVVQLTVDSLRHFIATEPQTIHETNTFNVVGADDPARVAKLTLEKMVPVKPARKKK